MCGLAASQIGARVSVQFVTRARAPSVPRIRAQPGARTRGHPGIMVVLLLGPQLGLSL